jgi:hypothetical protein
MSSGFWPQAGSLREIYCRFGFSTGRYEAGGREGEPIHGIKESSRNVSIQKTARLNAV